MEKFAYKNIATSATTTVKSGPGVLRRITVNAPGTTWTGTVYDNTAGSGTKIATIAFAAAQSTLVFDVEFVTGLTIVTAGTAGDITVAYE